MPLQPGTFVGPYKVLALLGVGGMGEVYRAGDPRLQREVAIKIITTLDDDRRRRFEIEARTAARLNHPNIAAVYDVGEANGQPYIVSELVEGETLSALLSRGAITIHQMLDIASGIAAGLAEAHDNGITHRDLKPDNIILNRSRMPKIVDFGLAKRQPMTPAESTVSAVSVAGVVMGTIAYMSPEQVRGIAVDHHSDQFSFGMVLYEMVTGKRAFCESSGAEIMAAIMRDAPQPIQALNPGVPPPLVWIIERCLAKDPASRYASTQDLHRNLQDLRDRLPELSSQPAAATPRAAGPPLWKKIAAAALFTAIGSLGAYLLLPREQLDLAGHRYVPFAMDPEVETRPIWSPDGKTIAYTREVDGVQQVYVRGLDAAVPTRVTNSRLPVTDPFFASDGSRVFYTEANALWWVGATGGVSQRLIDNASSGAFSPDGKALAFFRRNATTADVELWTASPDGQNAHKVERSPFPMGFATAELGYTGLRFSPNGSLLAVLLVRTENGESQSEIWILPQPTGEPRRVLKLPSSRVPGGISWVPGGREIVVSLPGYGSFKAQLHSVDIRTGTRRTLTATKDMMSSPAVSPDGYRIAASIGNRNGDIFEVPLDDGPIKKILATSVDEYDPSWMPTGSQYVYGSLESGESNIWLRSVAEGWARPLVRGNIEGDVLLRMHPKSSPDGQRISYLAFHPSVIWVVPLTGGTPVRLDPGSTSQSAHSWSPDGNWISYSCRRGGSLEIVKISSGGGGTPVTLKAGLKSPTPVVWSPTGEWISYADSDGLHLMNADGASHRLLTPDSPLFWAFTKDGKTLYALRNLPGRSVELSVLEVATGQRKNARTLDLPAGRVSGLSLHPDGNRLVLSVIRFDFDIWLIEGLLRPSNSYKLLEN